MSHVCRNEKHQWSTFLLFSESVPPGRVTKLQSFGQFEEKIQKLRKETHSCSQVATKKKKKQLSKTTQRNDAHGSKIFDESKVWMNSGGTLHNAGKTA